MMKHAMSDKSDKSDKLELGKKRQKLKDEQKQKAKRTGRLPEAKLK